MVPCVDCGSSIPHLGGFEWTSPSDNDTFPTYQGVELGSPSIVPYLLEWVFRFMFKTLTFLGRVSLAWFLLVCEW